MNRAVADDLPLAERVERMLYREFFSEKELYAEVGLERLPARLGALLSVGPDEAMARAVAARGLDEIPLAELSRLVQVHDMVFLSRTAATVAHELKLSDVTYEQCIREALSFAVSGRRSQAFAALRAAAVRNPKWARHHFIYGLLQAAAGNYARAVRELGRALEQEPYDDARQRIRAAIAVLEEQARAVPGI